MYRILSILFFVVVGSSTYGTADQIQMTNGDRLTGKIIKTDSEAIILKTAYAGEITVSLGAVEQIVPDPSLYASLGDGSIPISTIAVGIGDAERLPQNVVVEQLTQSGDAVSPQAVAQAEPEPAQAPGWLDLWVGAVDTNFNLTQGNAETINIGVGGDATRETVKNRTNVNVAYVFSRDSTFGPSMTTANSIRSGGRFEYKFGERFNTFTFTNLEHDPFQNLNLRVVVGGGFGWYVQKNTKTQFQVYAGGSYNRENFTDLIRNSGELLAGEKFNLKLTDRTTFSEGFEFFPNMNDLGEFRLTLNSGLSVGLNKLLSWKLTLSDRYLSNPFSGRNKNDLILTTGIGIAFGQ